MSAEDKDELARLKAHRKALISEYGSQGEKHPMGRLIGGLNPAAMELHSLRGTIARLQTKVSGPAKEKPVLTLRHGFKRKYPGDGWNYDVAMRGEHGHIGYSRGSTMPWYVIVPDGNGSTTVLDDKYFATLKDATKAFEKWAKGN